ncbi:ShET2/EspL2 family type III secretion system effector toxin [Paludibacterium paludis]|uniref:ShET2/EspL2 family type III secretion system effector toxin n=1 Tax=Paludibacterium paludis TaxID=1225769 RepID=UPI001C05D3CE|nr:ShET2/EspL2 family type III secretion system effector toxin [Paludibacterium paludis]
MRTANDVTLSTGGRFNPVALPTGMATVVTGARPASQTSRAPVPGEGTVLDTPLITDGEKAEPGTVASASAGLHESRPNCRVIPITLTGQPYQPEGNADVMAPVSMPSSVPSRPLAPATPAPAPTAAPVPIDASDLVVPAAPVARTVFRLDDAPRQWKALFGQFDAWQKAGAQHRHGGISALALLDGLQGFGTFMGHSRGPASEKEVTLFRPPYALGLFTERAPDQIDMILSLLQLVGALKGEPRLLDAYTVSMKCCGTGGRKMSRTYSREALDPVLARLIRPEHLNRVKALLYAQGEIGIALADVIDWEALNRVWNEKRTEEPAGPRPAEDFSGLRDALFAGEKAPDWSGSREAASGYLALREGLTPAMEDSLRYPALKGVYLQTAMQKAMEREDSELFKVCLLVMHPDDPDRLGIDTSRLIDFAKTLNNRRMVARLKCFPYRRGADAQLNCKVGFKDAPVPPGYIEPISCGHFSAFVADNYAVMPKNELWKILQSKEAIADRMTSQIKQRYHDIVSNNSDVYYFRNDKAEQLVRKIAARMNQEGVSRKSLVVTTFNHAMAVILDKKSDHYVLVFYDPNDTAKRTRVEFRDPDSFTLDLNEFFTKARLASYFPDQETGQEMLAYDTATAGMRRGNRQNVVLCQDKPAEYSTEQWLARLVLLNVLFDMGPQFDHSAIDLAEVERLLEAAGERLAKTGASVDRNNFLACVSNFALWKAGREPRRP